ncbi:FRG domain-containing protein [Staphylococcus arlettae]|uniref:FRG domain-containing protein n=1 Tax=Staphylococcus arlettae TaxID=29378 RepID=UPI001E49B4EC|nr:FRG domain-containing protein [Staphylococcus arlettae]MCD8864318.1 FRG domain-containing protein [Staphylococcus arlettae]
MTKSIYNEIQERIKYYDLYNTIYLKIKLIPNEQEDPYKPYTIIGIDIEDNKSENKQLNLEYEEMVDALNKKIFVDQTRHKKDWQLFYLIKEILQESENIDTCNFNYFRGQSSDWPMLPGILRSNTSTELKNNFEQIYKKIAYNYPQELKYIPYRKDNRIDRARQLSILQHYGMKTSLLDITKNPYISLLFIFSVSNKYKIRKPCLELYSIDEDKHFENHLFMRVQKDLNNKRIEAQKGAFLNYDSLYDINQTDVEKMDRVVIKIEFDKNEYGNQLEKDLNLAQEMIGEYNKNENKEDSQLEIINNFVSDLEKKIKLFEENVKHDETVKSDGDKKLFKESYEEIRREMLTKLREYHYFENHLYPDLDKQIEFMVSKYSDETKKEFIDEI